MSFQETEDPSWACYAQTILRFPGGPLIDLRARVGRDELAALRAHGLHGSFAVITAWNGRGRPERSEENRRRGEELLAEIRREGHRWHAVIGESPDGEHQEPGVAVEVPIDVAEALAIRYEQSAFFWFDGAAFTILGALVTTEPIRLPVARPRGASSKAPPAR